MGLFNGGVGAFWLEPGQQKIRHAKSMGCARICWQSKKSCYKHKINIDTHDKPGHNAPIKAIEEFRYMENQIYVNRKGGFVACEDDYNEQQKPISIGYLRRIVEHAKRNRAYYIDLTSARREMSTMRMMFNKVSKEYGVKIRTFAEDEETIGFVIAVKDYTLI